MGRVHVGEFSFDSLKEAQDYATKLKADPNYVPPTKPLAPSEGETNSGFVPAHDPELHSHGNETEDSEATKTSDAASSVVFHDPQEPGQEPEDDFLPDNYEDMTDEQKLDHDADMAQAVYESSTPEEQAKIDAENDAFDREHKINDYAEGSDEDYSHHDALAEEGLA